MIENQVSSDFKIFGQSRSTVGEKLGARSEKNSGNSGACSERSVGENSEHFRSVALEHFPGISSIGIPEHGRSDGRSDGSENRSRRTGAGAFGETVGARAGACLEKTFGELSEKPMDKF